MKRVSVLSLMVVVGFVALASQSRDASAQAAPVNANIQTTCTLDPSAAAIPIGAWLLAIGANNQPASVAIKNCNTSWTVTGQSTTGGSMTATAGSVDNGNNSVSGTLLSTPFQFDGLAATSAVPVGNGNPTVNAVVPVTYTQVAAPADPAIKSGTGSYQITLQYTLVFI